MSPVRLSLRGDIAEGNETSITVSEDFDEALNKVFPIAQESSALEARENCIYHSEDTGKRVFIPRVMICVAEELDGQA